MKKHFKISDRNNPEKYNLDIKFSTNETVAFTINGRDFHGRVISYRLENYFLEVHNNLTVRINRCFLKPSSYDKHLLQVTTTYRKQIITHITSKSNAKKIHTNNRRLGKYNRNIRDFDEEIDRVVRHIPANTLIAKLKHFGCINTHQAINYRVVLQPTSLSYNYTRDTSSRVYFMSYLKNLMMLNCFDYKQHFKIYYLMNRYNDLTKHINGLKVKDEGISAIRKLKSISKYYKRMPKRYKGLYECEVCRRRNNFTYCVGYKMGRRDTIQSRICSLCKHNKDVLRNNILNKMIERDVKKYKEDVMNKIVLRDSQKEFCNLVYDDIVLGHKVVAAQSPTGSGKSINIASIVWKLNKNNESAGDTILWLQGKPAIMKQNYLEFEKICKSYKSDLMSKVMIDHAIGDEVDYIPRVIFSTNLTYANRIKQGVNHKDISLIIIDEFHNAGSNTYKYIIESYPNAQVFGTTATLYRDDNKLNFIDKVSCIKTINDIILERGYNPPTFVKGLRLPSVSAKIEEIIKGKNITTDIEKQVQDEISIREFYYSQSFLDHAIAMYQKYCYSGKTVVYCMDTKHANFCYKYFSSMYKCLIVTQNENQLKDTLDYSDAEYDLLFNVYMLKEGINDPNINHVMFFKPITKHTFFIQAVGRVRLSPIKKPNIVDIGISYHTHKSISLNMSECGYCEDCKTMKYDNKGYCLNCKNHVLKGYKHCRACKKRINKFENECPYCKFDLTSKVKSVEKVKEKQNKVSRLKLIDECIHTDLISDIKKIKWFNVERYDRKYIIMGRSLGAVAICLDNDTPYIAFGRVGKEREGYKTQLTQKIILKNPKEVIDYREKIVYYIKEKENLIRNSFPNDDLIPYWYLNKYKFDIKDTYNKCDKTLIGCCLDLIILADM